MKPTPEMIKRLIDAVEGECDGLAIEPHHARAILEYVLEPSVLTAALAVQPVAVRVKEEAFDKIVKARKNHVDAVAAYNARRELATAERMRGNWAMKLDAEYHAMSDAQAEYHRTVQDIADAAIATTEGKDNA